MASQAEQLAALQAQVETLTSLLSGTLGDTEGRKKAEERIAERQPLEPAASERDRILAFWAAEPRVQIHVAPTEDEQKAAKAMKTREFPPRIFQVNGVQMALPVGKITTVPESIAALYAYTLDPWSARRDPKPHTFEEAEERLALV